MFQKLLVIAGLHSRLTILFLILTTPQTACILHQSGHQRRTAKFWTHGELLEAGDGLQADSPAAQPLSHADKKTLTSNGGNEGNHEDLPHVADKIPISAWSVILISALDCFASFGIREPFRKWNRFTFQGLVFK